MKHFTKVGNGYVYYTSPANVAVRILLYYSKGDGIIASIGQIIRMPSGLDLATSEPNERMVIGRLARKNQRILDGMAERLDPMVAIAASFYPDKKRALTLLLETARVNG